MNEVAEDGDEAGRHGFELGQVLGRQPSQQGLPFGRQRNEREAPVGCRGGTGNEAAPPGTVDELDGAVVADEKAFGDLADGDAGAGIPRLEGKEELMLLGVEAGVACGGLAEVEEVADGVAEFVEERVVALRWFSSGSRVLVHCREYRARA